MVDSARSRTPAPTGGDTHSFFQWQRQPDDRVAVIDSTTPELAAELAADPDGFAAQYDAIYASPTISSGVSFSSWAPDAVLVFSGGHIGPFPDLEAALAELQPSANIFADGFESGNADAWDQSVGR